MMNEHYVKMLEAVRASNPYNLYIKSDAATNLEKLMVSMWPHVRYLCLKVTNIGAALLP